MFALFQLNVWERRRSLFPGSLLATTVAAAAMFMSEHFGAPVMLFALLIGMAFNFLVADGHCKEGIDFASRTVLRAGTERAQRPAYLLSGLLKCGVCGGGYSKINATHYACSKARDQGTCSNRLTIRRTEVEDRVLNGLRSRLMQPELVKLFVQEFNAEVNRLWQERHGERDRQEAEFRMVQKDLDRAVDAVLSGICSEEIQNRITELEVRKADLTKQLNTPKEVMPALHPGIADVYAAKVANLAEALNAPDIRTQSAEALRALIDEVRLTPQDGALNVELYGELAALIALGLNRPDRNRPSRNRNAKRPKAQDLGAQITLVAGARSHLYRTRVRL